MDLRRFDDFSMNSIEKATNGRYMFPNELELLIRIAKNGYILKNFPEVDINNMSADDEWFIESSFDYKIRYYDYNKLSVIDMLEYYAAVYFSTHIIPDSITIDQFDTMEEFDRLAIDVRLQLYVWQKAYELRKANKNVYEFVI